MERDWKIVKVRNDKDSEKSSMNSRDQRYAVVAENGSINIYFEKKNPLKKTYRFNPSLHLG